MNDAESQFDSAECESTDSTPHRRTGTAGRVDAITPLSASSARWRSAQTAFVAILVSGGPQGHLCGHSAAVRRRLTRLSTVSSEPFATSV